MWQRITRMNGKVTIVLAAAVFSVGTAGYMSTVGRDQFHWAFAPLAVSAPLKPEPGPLMVEGPTVLADATPEPILDPEPTAEPSVAEPVRRVIPTATPERSAVLSAGESGDVVPITSTAVPYPRAWGQPGPVYHAPDYPPPSFVPPPMAEPEVTPPPTPEPVRTPLPASLDYGVSPTPIPSAQAANETQVTAVNSSTPVPIAPATVAPVTNAAPHVPARTKGSAKAARR